MEYPVSGSTFYPTERNVLEINVIGFTARCAALENEYGLIVRKYCSVLDYETCGLSNYVSGVIIVERALKERMVRACKGMTAEVDCELSVYHI